MSDLVAYIPLTLDKIFFVFGVSITGALIIAVIIEVLIFLERRKQSKKGKLRK